MNYKKRILQQIKEQTAFRKYYNNEFKGVQRNVNKLIIEWFDLLDSANGVILIENDLNKIIELETRILNELDTFNKRTEFYNKFISLNDDYINYVKDINNIQSTPPKLTEVQKYFQQQTRQSMQSAGIMQGVTKPLNLLLQNIIQEGMSKTDAKNLLIKWNEGEGEALFGNRGFKKIQNLEQYFGQMANDSIQQFNGNIQNTIQKEYKLNGIIVVGGLVEASRPFCKHLVERYDGRKIPLEYLGVIIKKFIADKDLNKGMIEGTNKENICVYKGGYNCLHEYVPVLMTDVELKAFKI